MTSRQPDLDEPIIGLFSLFDSLNLNWFLSNRSCLEFIRTGYQVLYKNTLDIGIYGNSVDERFFKNFSIWKAFYHEGEVSELTLITNFRVNVYLFRDFYGYIVETRHQEALNRCQVLCYDPKIIVSGIERIPAGKRNLNVLKNRAEYCNTLFGNNFLAHLANRKDTVYPDNIIWEDFIEIPRRLA